MKIYSFRRYCGCSLV